MVRDRLINQGRIEFLMKPNANWVIWSYAVVSDYFARDVVAYSLGYFDNVHYTDYKAIHTGTKVQPDYDPSGFHITANL